MDRPVGACGQLDPAGVHSDNKRRCPATVHRLPLVVAMVAKRYRLSLVSARSAEVEAAVTLRPRAAC